MKYSRVWIYSLFFLLQAPPILKAEETPPPAVDHILLEVKDLNRSIKFYRDQLGLKLEKKSGGFVTMKAANIGIFLWSDHWKWSPPAVNDHRPPQGMYPHLVFTDVKGVVNRLRQAGYQIVADAKDYNYGTEAFVADPDGFVWSLITPQK